VTTLLLLVGLGYGWRFDGLVFETTREMVSSEPVVVWTWCSGDDGYGVGVLEGTGFWVSLTRV